eukprot:TRINITY_DN2040_c0_g1_i1.p2 TRINITY_DN2040_c0_g1~~TRINITY_DN2040_c0_g1_i1.p2  ORF type:complete len:110 (-),score=12.83 TRINITY_DN2040_c0_g1_i1:156-485(-)
MSRRRSPPSSSSPSSSFLSLSKCNSSPESGQKYSDTERQQITERERSARALKTKAVVLVCRPHHRTAPHRTAVRKTNKYVTVNALLLLLQWGRAKTDDSDKGGKGWGTN